MAKVGVFRKPSPIFEINKRRRQYVDQGVEWRLQYRTRSNNKKRRDAIKPRKSKVSLFAQITQRHHALAAQGNIAALRPAYQAAQRRPVIFDRKNNAALFARISARHRSQVNNILTVLQARQQQGATQTGRAPWLEWKAPRHFA